jgi:hypothetical protein
VRLIGLLARRAAELPRYRVRAQLRHTPGFGADLELEPQAWLTGRAGDIPFDFAPDPVPAEDRTPYAHDRPTLDDTQVVTHARSIAAILRSSGEQLRPIEAESLDDLELQLEPGAEFRPEYITAQIGVIYSQLNEGERPITQELADRLHENSYALADLGFREPLDRLQDTGLESVVSSVGGYQQLAQWQLMLPRMTPLQRLTPLQQGALEGSPLGFRPAGSGAVRYENPYAPGQQLPRQGIDPRLGGRVRTGAPEEFSPSYIPPELLPPEA